MPWQYKTARALCEAFAVAFLPKEKPYGIRAFQYIKDGQFYKTKGLGRLTLTEKSVARWAFGAPASEKPEMEREFGEFELWSPHWDKCADAGTPPDILLKFSQQSMPTDRIKRKIAGFMVIAFASEIYDSDHTKSFLNNEILKQFKRPQAFSLLRRWAYPTGSAFHLSIQDFPHNGVFKDSVQPFADLIEKNQLQEAWAPL